MGDDLYNLIVDVKYRIDNDPSIIVDGKALIETLFWLQNGDWDDMDLWEARKVTAEFEKRIFSTGAPGTAT